MLDNAILDADFCIRIGSFKSIKLLEIVIPVIVKQAYIHQYVYNDEILIPASAKEQIKSLVNSGQVEILDDSTFTGTDKALFDATRD